MYNKLVSLRKETPIRKKETIRTFHAIVSSYCVTKFFYHRNSALL